MAFDSQHAVQWLSVDVDPDGNVLVTDLVSGLVSEPVGTVNRSHAQQADDLGSAILELLTSAEHRG